MSQEEINETINKPNILNSLKEIPFQDKTEAERNAMTWQELSEYHSKMVYKQNLIKELTDPVLISLYQQTKELEQKIKNENDLKTILPNRIAKTEIIIQDLDEEITQLEAKIIDPQTVFKTELEFMHEHTIEEKSDRTRLLQNMKAKLTGLSTSITNTQTTLTDHLNMIKAKEQEELNKCGSKTFDELLKDVEALRKPKEV